MGDGHRETGTGRRETLRLGDRRPETRRQGDKVTGRQEKGRLETGRQAGRWETGRGETRDGRQGGGRCGDWATRTPKKGCLHAHKKEKLRTPNDNLM